MMEKRRENEDANHRVLVSGCRKTPQKTDATEQRGVCAGGKKPTARSINRILKLFESFKIRTAGRKYFFDTLMYFPLL